MHVTTHPAIGSSGRVRAHYSAESHFGIEPLEGRWLFSGPFSIGERVTILQSGVNARSNPAGSIIVGMQTIGETGSVTGGPTVASLNGTSFTWYDVNWDAGPDGWSADTFIGSLPAAPTAAPHNQTVAPGTSIPLTTLFTYSAASGDSIVGFDVEQTSNKGGYLTDNGTKQSANVLYGPGEFGLAIGQIGQWAFVSGPSGTSDTIGFNVDDQYGQFNNPGASVVVTAPAKPTATPHNQTVVSGTSIPLTTLFSYSAASGDSIVGFDIEQTSNNGGYLTDNGTKQLANVLYGPGEFGLPISQIGQWAFVAGPGATSDTIGFNVDDQYGQFNNPAATATVTATLPAAPTATNNNQTVAPGTSVPLAMLFSYSSVSGDSIVGFDVEQTSNNGGYLTDNGTKQSANVLYGPDEFGLPISQIGQWAFVAGPSGSSDTIGFNVDDQYGQFNNPAATATVTTTGSASYTYGVDFEIPRVPNTNARGTASWSNELSSDPTFAYIKATQDTVGNFLPANMPPTVPASDTNFTFGLYDFADPTQYLDPTTKIIRSIDPANSTDLNADAKAEADFFYQTGAPYLTAGHLLPALDLEYTNGFGFDSRWTSSSTGWMSIANWITAWTREFQAQSGMAGVFPILYMDQYFAGNLASLLDQSVYKLWIAIGSPGQPVQSPGDQYWNPALWDWAIEQYQTTNMPYPPDLDALNPSGPSLSSLEIGQSTGGFGSAIGSFNGVIDYSNGNGEYVSNIYNDGVGIDTGMEWQCVEYVNRYYYLVYGLDIRIPGENANQYFGNASARGLTSYSDGGSVAPKVGDILCFGGGAAGTGHVAIIRAISSNSVIVIQQNVKNGASGPNGTDDDYTFTYDPSTDVVDVLSPGSSNLGPSYYCQGWLSPSVTSAPTSETWVGTASADWNSSANWSGGVVPGPQTNVVLSSVTVTADLPFDIGSLALNGATLLLPSSVANAVSYSKSPDVSSPLVSSSGSQVYFVSDLTLSNAGTIDLGSDELFIDFSNISDPKTMILQSLASGYAGGSWNGSGIISSAAATSKSVYGIGFADGADGVVSGLNNGQIELKYTLNGDANLDGVVNASDYEMIDNGFNAGLSDWNNGDFNYDGIINGDDYTLIDNAYNTQNGVSSAAVPAQTVAPTPTSQAAKPAQLIALATFIAQTTNPPITPIPPSNTNNASNIFSDDDLIFDPRHRHHNPSESFASPLQLPKPIR